MLPREAFIALGTLFILSEVATVTVGLVATATPKHKWLWPWVPSLHLYYPLATLAAIKGLWEIITRPYYWDKTTHGVADNCGTLLGSSQKSAPAKLPKHPSQTRVQKPSLSFAQIAPATRENAPLVARHADHSIANPNLKGKPAAPAPSTDALPTFRRAQTTPPDVRPTPANAGNPPAHKPTAKPDPKIKKALAIAASPDLLVKAGFSEPKHSFAHSSERSGSRFLSFIPGVGQKVPRRRLKRARSRTQIAGE